MLEILELLACNWGENYIEWANNFDKGHIVALYPCALVTQTNMPMMWDRHSELDNLRLLNRFSRLLLVSVDNCQNS